MSVSIAEITGWEPVPKGQLELTIVPLPYLDRLPDCEPIERAPHTIAGIALSAGNIELSHREVDLVNDRSRGMTYEESAHRRKFSVSTEKNRGARLIGQMRAGSMNGVISRVILLSPKRLGMRYSGEPLETPLTPQQQLLACGLVLGLADKQIAGQLGLSTGPIREWKTDLFREQPSMTGNRPGKRERAARWLHEHQLFVPVPPELAQGLWPNRIPNALITAAEPLVAPPGRAFSGRRRVA